LPDRRLYLVTRDLHLYLGLFFTPFLLVFCASAVMLAHAWVSGSPAAQQRWTAHAASIAGLETLDGRARVEALQAVLPRLGLAGEIGFVRYVAKERRLVFPVTVPGREVMVDIRLDDGEATLTRRETGFWDGLVLLHKSPGQHLAMLRMNWWPMWLWRGFADGTVYAALFLSLSGLYLWLLLRAERRAGLFLLAVGALSFAGVVYALVA
jgi:hypothetical protein